MIISNMTNGETSEGKQLLFIFTIASLGLMSLYYFNQIKISRMKIKELNKQNAELILSQDQSYSLKFNSPIVYYWGFLFKHMENKIYTINICPKPTPRPRVRTIIKNGKRINATYYPTEYQQYKDALTLMVKQLGIEQKDYHTLWVTFGIPYPKTVKGGKKERIEGKLHQLKPDLDNYLKGKKDALTQSLSIFDDSKLAIIHASKLWTNSEGYIKFMLEIQALVIFFY